MKHLKYLEEVSEALIEDTYGMELSR